MTFLDSITTCFSKYADFSGRATRAEYWWFALFIILSGLICSAINDTLGTVYTVATLVPSIAAAARRLHDTDRSGWWQLLGLIPIVGWIIVIVFLAQKGTPGSNRFGNEVTSEVDVVDHRTI